MATEENIICCCGPRMWTRVIGWLELVGYILPALIGTIMIGANEAEDWQLVGITLAFIGLAVLINIFLLVGNEKEKAGLFLPWLLSRSILVGLCGLGVFGLGMSNGDLKYVSALLIQMLISGFCIFAVLQRHTEISKNSGSGLQRPTVVSNAKV